MTNNNLILQKKIETSCAVCIYSDHAGITDVESDRAICTLDMNHPALVNLEDTCLSFKPKFKNLKVIIDDSHLEEYDPEETKRDTKIAGIKIPTTTEIGEDEWQN